MFKSSRMYVSLPSGNRIRKRSVVWIICLMTTWYAGTSVRRSVRLMVKEYARAPSCPSCHVIRAFCAVSCRWVSHHCWRKFSQVLCLTLVKRVSYFRVDSRNFFFFCMVDFSLCRIQLHHRLPITPSPTHSYTHTHTTTTANILRRHWVQSMCRGLV